MTLTWCARNGFSGDKEISDDTNKRLVIKRKKLIAVSCENEKSIYRVVSKDTCTMDSVFHCDTLKIKKGNIQLFPNYRIISIISKLYVENHINRLKLHLRNIDAEEHDVREGDIHNVTVLK